jgi:hypothetical protein
MQKCRYISNPWVLGDFVFAPNVVKKFRTCPGTLAEKKNVQSVEPGW